MQAILSVSAKREIHSRGWLVVYGRPMKGSTSLAIGTTHNMCVRRGGGYQWQWIARILASHSWVKVHRWRKRIEKPAARTCKNLQEPARRPAGAAGDARASCTSCTFKAKAGKCSLPARTWYQLLAFCLFTVSIFYSLMMTYITSHPSNASPPSALYNARCCLCFILTHKTHSPVIARFCIDAYQLGLAQTRDTCSLLGPRQNTE
jgi:hypothetical protein